MTTYCDQGHPAHDAELGCGPCREEELAGLGERPYGLPEAARLYAQRAAIARADRELRRELEQVADPKLRRELLEAL